MLASYIDKAQTCAQPSIDDNPVMVATYSLKALKVICYAFEGVDLGSGLPTGEGGLVVKQ
jgi:hypothetical protein